MLSYKDKYFSSYIACIIIFLHFNLYSQNNDIGIPFFENYPPRVYGYENQNFSVVEGDNGLMYFGNTNGILEYNGYTWRLLPLYGIINFAKTPNGTVYVGAFGEFGFIQPNNKNIPSYFSLVKDNKTSKIEGKSIISILPKNNDSIYVISNNIILMWNGNDFETIDSTDSYINGKIIDGEVFFFEYSSGIFKIINGKREYYEWGNFFKNKLIEGMISFKDNSILVKTSQDHHFWLIHNNKISAFYTNADDFIKENIFASFAKAGNDYFVVGTRRSGVLFFDMKGNLVTSLDRSTGLHDDHVNDLYCDNAGNLWVALNNGISRIDFPSAFSYFSYESGIKGGISAIKRFKGKIYIATNQGLYFLDKSVLKNEKRLIKDAFKLVDGLDFECNQLLPFNDYLLVTTNRGVYTYNNKIKEVVSGQIEGIIQCRFNENVFYLAGNGLFKLEYTKDKRWTVEQYENISHLIRTVAQDDYGNIWIGSDFFGTYKIIFNGKWSTKAPFVEYAGGNGLPENFEWVDVYYTSNGMLFSTYHGVYRFNEKTDMFYADQLLGYDFSTGKKWVFPIYEDIYKNIWYSCATKDVFEKETGIAFYNGKNKKYSLVYNNFKKIKDYTIESIYPDTGTIAWFGSYDGLFRFDAKYFFEDTLNFKPFLTKIIIGEDSLIYTGNKIIYDSLIGEYLTIVPSFKYKLNHVKFYFSAPFYIGQKNILYQCYLEGFDKTWQVWDSSPFKDYSYLPEGKYTFRLRAKNQYGKLSEEYSFTFEILPPIHRHWIAYIIYLTTLVTFIVMVMKWRSHIEANERIKLERLLAERTEELVKQKERAEELVQNILPKDTAEELVSKGHASRKKYKMVTVLFSDVEGFTRIAEHMNPEKLLNELDKFFLFFDEVVERLGIEKIKTIGDAYMCAGGIPLKNRTNPIDVVLAAIEIQQYMKTIKTESQNEWDIRVGIHTGPVIAGVMGSKKYSYDIWGDTVNIASRMESTGEAGEINISETTFDLVKDFFDCEYRGKLPVKYKGEIDMYFVKGIKEKLSVNGDSLHPNELFQSKIQLIRFSDLEELIMTKLDKGLPQNLYYHNIKHTIDVMVQTEILAISEGVTKEDLLLLKTAALFHDTGFLIGYDDHEFLSIKMAKEILPQFKYSEEQIKIISDLIYVTKLPPTPKTKLERIMCDADLDYLGRNDFIPVSQNLFREMYERGKVKSIEEWNTMQYEFVSKHKYFTETAIKIRENNRNQIVEELKNMIS